MKYIKKVLVLIVLVELLIAIVLITEESIKRLDHISNIFFMKDKSLNVKILEDDSDAFES